MNPPPHIDRESLLAAGLERFQAGKPDEAAVFYEQVLDADPNDPDALHLLGLAHHKAGRGEEAVEFFKRAIEADPASPQIHNNLGNVLSALGNKDEAAKHYQLAINQDPDHAAAHFNLGLLFVDFERLDSALAGFSRAMEIDPQKAERLFESEKRLDPIGRYLKTRPDDRRNLQNLRVFNFSDLETHCQESNTEFSELQSPIALEMGTNRPMEGHAFFLAELNDGGVLGGSCLPVAGTGKVFVNQLTHNPLRLAVSSEYQERASVILANGKQLMVSADEEETYKGPHLLLGSQSNIGHWLLNHFSRLLLVEDREDLKALPVVVAGDLSGSRLECLTRLGYGEDRIVRVPPGKIAWFERLWVPSFPYFGSPESYTIFWSPDVVHFIRRALGVPSQRHRGRPPRRLFLTRRGAEWRILKNEDEVFAVLEPLGFERIDPGELSLDDQINIASEADIIMSPFGAGMNLHLFAPEGTHVVELKYGRIEMDIHPFIAPEIGQHHHQIDGSPEDSENPDLYSDFTVSADEVASLAKRLLETD